MLVNDVDIYIISTTVVFNNSAGCQCQLHNIYLLLKALSLTDSVLNDWHTDIEVRFTS